MFKYVLMDGPSGQITLRPNNDGDEAMGISRAESNGHFIVARFESEYPLHMLVGGLFNSYRDRVIELKRAMDKIRDITLN